MKKLILILIAIFTLSFVSCSNEDDFIEPSTTVYIVEQRGFTIQGEGIQFETSRVYKITNCKLEESGQYESFKKRIPCIKPINKISGEGDDAKYDYQYINKLQLEGYSILKTDAEMFAYKTVSPTPISCDCSIAFLPNPGYIVEENRVIVKRFSWKTYYQLRDELYDIWFHNIFGKDFLTAIDNTNIYTGNYSCRIVTDELKLQQHTAEFNSGINSYVDQYDVHYDNWNQKQ